MNMDGRSALPNTESGLLIDSPQLSSDVLKLREYGRAVSTHRRGRLTRSPVALRTPGSTHRGRHRSMRG